MDFEFAQTGAEVDWSQFLNTDATFVDPASPASDGHATPKSTESEQSLSLDPPVADDDFDIFNFSSGIMHSAEDIFADLPSYSPAAPAIPDQRGLADPTMISTFGAGFGDFGALTGLGQDAASQLGLIDVLPKFETPAVTLGTDVSAALAESYAALGWVFPSSAPGPAPAPAVTAVEPAALISPGPSLKRKISDASADSAAKRPRGRPPKTRAVDAPLPTVKRPYRRQSKSIAESVQGTPLNRVVAFADEDDSDAEPESPKTASGKPSTARPKSVVPEKYFKDGSAQAILGMGIDEILSFPTFEELLKKVAPHLQLAAAEFGERIKENRDKAKDAAKKSRDERRAKIDTLEATVEQLQDKILGMRGVLLGLVAKGLVTPAEMQAFL